MGRKGGRKEVTHTHTRKRLLGLQSGIYTGSEENKHLIVLTSCKDCREQSSPDSFGDTKKISYLSGIVMSKGDNIPVRAFMKRFKIGLLSFFIQTKIQYT